MISDETAVKPADWDEEIDGVWEAPLVKNPLCEDNGCGKWEPPMIANPAYRGKWRAPLLDNPVRDFIFVFDLVLIIQYFH